MGVSHNARSIKFVMISLCVLEVLLLISANASIDEEEVAAPAASTSANYTNHSAAAARELAAATSTAAKVLGMDVSSYQGKVNWEAAYSKGARFAYVKATEGTGYVNPYFSEQYVGAYKVGMIRGAYHFGRPDKSSGAAQAKYFVKHGGGWSRDGKTLPGALDLEGSCYGLSQHGMATWIAAFINTYHSTTGVYPVIYTSASWYNTCVGHRGDFSSKCPLWLACYCPSASSLPYHWTFYTIWQYADHGTFPGDQNVFNGSLQRLRALALG